MNALAASGKRCAFGGADSNIIQHLVQMRLGNQRAHLHIICHRITNPHGARAFNKRCLEFGGNGFLDIDTGGVRADFASGIEICCQRGFNSCVEICVGENDQG